MSESPGSNHGEKFDDEDDSSMDEGPLVEKRKSIGPGEVALLVLLIIKYLFLCSCDTETA